MKITVIFLFGILAAVLVAGHTLDSKGEYPKEREIWAIQRDFQRLSNHQESIPAYALEKIIERYNHFSKKHQQSPLAPKAQLLKGEVYLLKKDFTQAREIFKEVASKYSYNAEVVAQAMVFIGRSYEQQQDWTNAKDIYASVIKDYPLTAAGFSVPAYIGYYYLSHGQNKEAQQAFNEAVMFYENMANSYPNSPLEYTALRMVSECQIAQKKWEEALRTTREWMFKYPSSLMLFEAIRTINDVCIGQLKEYNCAIDTYKQFLVQNPEHPIRPMLKKMIWKLENLKTKTSSYPNN